MNSKLITAIVLSLVAVACSGSTETGGSTGGAGGGGGDGPALTPREFFIKEVFPELGKNCAICHAPGDECAPPFMRTTAEGSYDELRAFGGLVVHAENSNLIHYGAHTGPALTATLEELVTEWLKLERPEPPSGKTQLQALDEFGPCMTQPNFTSTGFYKLAYQQTDAGPCGSCHKTGEAGTWLGFNQGEMFERNQERPWIKRLVKATFDGDGNFVDLVASTRLIDKVEVNCGSPHPSASVYDENVIAISEYFEITHQAWMIGDCGTEP
jgi:hypothetical protein